MKLDDARSILMAGTLVAAMSALPAIAQTTDRAGDTEPAAGAAPAGGGATEASPAKTAEPADGGADTATDDAAQDISAATEIANVGDRAITLGEVIALRSDLPEQYQKLPDEILSQGLIDQLIDQTLLEEAARADGIDERLDVALSIRNQIRAILAEEWLRAEVNRRLTDERVRAAYDERHAKAAPVEEVRAAHILVEEEEKAKELKAELDAGADFAALAAEHGTDGTASQGGDLGWFTKEDMVPEFAEAAFSIPPGEIGGPVKSPFGWHLIKVEEKRQKPVPPFEEVREALAGEVAQEIQAEILEELRAKTPVVVSEPPVPAAAIRADDLILPESAEPEGGDAAQEGEGSAN